MLSLVLQAVRGSEYIAIQVALTLAAAAPAGTVRDVHTVSENDLDFKTALIKLQPTPAWF